MEIVIDKHFNLIEELELQEVNGGVKHQICPYVINGAGGAISGIYGAALAGAVGGPVGIFAGIGLGIAFNLAWTPVSNACNR